MGGVFKEGSKRHHDPFSMQTEFQRVMDSLEILAGSFFEPSLDPSSTNSVDFVKAYLNNGTVTRDPPPSRSWEEDIFSKSFKENHRASERSATMPRDYIFATMPQFPWYQNSAEAKNMTFNEIFADFYQQAKTSGHTFICRITKSMTDLKSCTSYADAWEPSDRVWDPTTLGDFLKLFAGKLPQQDGVVPNLLIAHKISVKEIEEHDLIDENITVASGDLHTRS
ncbi:hypothetical protein MMC22_005954 [Lobaria immixta]|nr:hypothetical protein [Lobaria immixta]